MIQAYLVGDKIKSSSPDAFALFEKSKFGEKKSGFVEYSGVEALYLLSENKLSLFSNKKSISSDFLTKKLRKKDKKIETNLQSSMI